MKTQFLFYSLVISILVTNQANGQIITDKNRLLDIQTMLVKQKQMMGNHRSEIWSYLETVSNSNERQALNFLYAYMPLSDLADYEPSFFHANVKQSIKATKELSWGTTIPENVFLHFVLPIRVNNENLDSFRLAQYHELKMRVKNLSMREAALEINHWCHEKVTYRGTDMRTSSPLSTMKKTFGRCGEESTFAVAAMRTVGIPARQVYTPRWAHSDDNHAWVEVWIDGKWYYLGACEPEADLNIGWFSEPATRTILVHTRAYGRYFGDEDVVATSNWFSELNLTANYTVVKTVNVKVTDGKNIPVDSAKIEFKLYNYAEYYPVATTYTDKHGLAKLSLGLGDLLIWTAKNEYFDYRKISVADTDTLNLILNKKRMDETIENYDLIPPHAVKFTSTISAEDKYLNDCRLAYEDSVRGVYATTFRDDLWCYGFSQKFGINAKRVANLIHKSYGNWREIALFIKKNVEASPDLTFALLDNLAEKDLSDTKESILTDHLQQALNSELLNVNISDQVFVPYVLSPRIYYENLSAWRSYLHKVFPSETVLATRNDIHVLTNWIKANIKINNEANQHSRASLTPIGVYKLRICDELSRSIFFVAVCRTFGIPARLNSETNEPEYWKSGNWFKVAFTKNVTNQPITGNLTLKNGTNLIVPEYFIHFTIARFKNGFYHTLDFGETTKITDLNDSIELEVGDYKLITGNRREDGSVLSSITYFSIKNRQTTKITVQMRQDFEPLKPITNIKLNDFFVEKINLRHDSSFVVLVLLDPEKEPSKHILSDLGMYFEHFSKLDGEFIFIVAPEKTSQIKVLDSYQLPTKHTIVTDGGNNIYKSLAAKLASSEEILLPVVILSNGVGDIYLFSEGYKIGIGEQLLKTIHRIQ